MDILSKQNKVFISLFVLLLFWTSANQILTARVLYKVLGVQITRAGHLTGDVVSDAQTLVFTQGKPRIYGKELGINMYPDPRDIAGIEASISILRKFDHETMGIELAGEKLERYKKLGYMPTIACEFCCPVKALIFPDGSRACGCAHSYAMRGLMKYLIENHGDEFTDDEILREVIRWKAIFFPKQMMKRYMEQAPSGQFTPDMAALMYGIKIKKGAAVKQTDISEALKSLPDMAGGC